MEAPPPHKFAYSVKEVADGLGITRPTVYRLIGEGKLRTVNAGVRRLIPADALAEYLAGDDAA